LFLSRIEDSPQLAAESFNRQWNFFSTMIAGKQNKCMHYRAKHRSPPRGAVDAPCNRA
jgi:hypothetical protein